MNKTKIYDVVYKQIVYLMYTSRSFGLPSRDNSVRRAIRNSTLIRISNVIAYSIAIMVVGIISAFTKNAPLSLIFMDLIIFANIITTGLNIMFFVSNSDLKTFLLSLPLNDKEANFAIIRGIFEFFYYGFLISIIFTPIIVFFSTLSVLQAIMSELEVIFVFSISFALMIIVGKRIKLGIASTLFRVGTSLFWVLFIILPYGFTFRNYSLPYYLL
ncbi:MAG: permease, partial [Saccharolobus sp.]